MMVTEAAVVGVGRDDRGNCSRIYQVQRSCPELSVACHESRMTQSVLRFAMSRHASSGAPKRRESLSDGWASEEPRLSSNSRGTLVSIPGLRNYGRS